jgi:hypothetical protein
MSIGTGAWGESGTGLQPGGQTGRINPRENIGKQAYSKR